MPFGRLSRPQTPGPRILQRDIPRRPGNVEQDLAARLPLRRLGRKSISARTAEEMNPASSVAQQRGGRSGGSGALDGGRPRGKAAGQARRGREKNASPGTRAEPSPHRTVPIRTAPQNFTRRGGFRARLGLEIGFLGEPVAEKSGDQVQSGSSPIRLVMQPGPTR